MNGHGAYSKFASIINKISPVFKIDAAKAAIILFDFKVLFLSYPISTISLRTIYWSKNVTTTRETEIPGPNKYTVSAMSDVYRSHD